MNINDIYPAGDSDFIKLEDVANGAIKLTIAKAETQESKFGLQVVLSFVNSDKKFGLNKTNARMLAQNRGTGEISEWAGTDVVLCAGEIKTPDGMKQGVLVHQEVKFADGAYEPGAAA